MTDLDDVGTGSHPLPGARNRLHAWNASPEGSEDTQELDALQREVQDLRDALASQPVIDQAKGALMLRYGVDAESAFGLMVRWSQNANIKVRDIAHALVQALVDGSAGDHHPALARELALVLAHRTSPGDREG